VPVIILADQYLLDSGFDVDMLPLSHVSVESAVVWTEPGYRRYALTASGISPRGIPGWGDALVAADSHEDDEDGHISEDLDLRIQMVDKRMRKLDSIVGNTPPPNYFGPSAADILIVCWGSTFEIVREAVAALGRNDLALMHFQQVFPLPKAIPEQFRKTAKLILLEGNPTGQFGALLTQQWGLAWQHKILKYNGLQFTVEEVCSALLKILGKEEVL